MGNVPRALLFSLVFLATTFALAPAGAKEYRGHAHVVDGDTIEIGQVRIRFFGIDAPEKRQMCKDAQGQIYACGLRSTDFLRRLIGRRIVVCRDKGPAINNRRRGFCAVGPIDLQKAMVEAGHARMFRLHSERYRPEHEQAKAAKKGIWQGYHKRPGAVRACRRQGRGTIHTCSF